MRSHAGLDPVRTLGAVSNETVTGDVDSRTVKGIDRIPSAFLNIGWFPLQMQMLLPTVIMGLIWFLQQIEFVCFSALCA